MNKIKVKLFFAKNGKWIYSGLGLICIIAIIYLYNRLNINIIGTVGKWSGEIIAVLGTLLGAVIGGAFTLWGSIYVNKKQLKAQTHIKRKNIIYKPLYDELCDIQFNVLTENPYPSRIAFELEDRGPWKYPQYAVWNRIKSDTRYLETPKAVIFEMEKLYLKIDEYKKSWIGDNQFAEDLKVSKTYLFDIFHNRINPPTPDKQEQIIALLKLNENEKLEFLDKAAVGRGELPKDIVQFLTDNPNEIKKIRERMRA